MASKKELEERLAALEVEVALLRAQVHHQPMKVLPRPSDVPWPRDWNPYWPPHIQRRRALIVILPQ